MALPAADLIDDLEPWLHLPISLSARLDLLPTHLWMCRYELDLLGLVTPGDLWTVCATLVAEAIDESSSLIVPIAPLAVLRLHGRPIGPEVIPRLTHARQPLVPIHARTKLTVLGTYEWGDGKVPGVHGHAIDFESPRGQTIRLATEARANADDRNGTWRQGLTWREFACGAMVVPVDHPIAKDPRACESLLKRIERRGRRAFILSATATFGSP
jgi:hypothetical protein